MRNPFFSREKTWKKFSESPFSMHLTIKRESLREPLWGGPKAIPSSSLFWDCFFRDILDFFAL
ncbi:MAG: hypothetical protein A2007_06135 [Verrucomicrobia bacterium GWC2_42_7]|nr:MAG: hypothetical protein A2007_06135 [Verrucomicrobia bacterium GWC2_42_7]